MTIAKITSFYSPNKNYSFGKQQVPGHKLFPKQASMETGIICETDKYGHISSRFTYKSLPYIRKMIQTFENLMNDPNVGEGYKIGHIKYYLDFFRKAEQEVLRHGFATSRP